MFIIKANKWTHDGKFNVTNKSQQHVYEFRGATLKEAMCNCQDAKDHNDMTRFTPINIYDVINTAEVVS
jgi:environmental stress-induced protein Ves